MMASDDTQTVNGPKEESFRCTIKHMFRGCPKDNGWFGCFAHIKGADDGNDIKLSGITNIPLVDGMQLDVVVTKTGDEYKIKSFEVVTKSRTGMISYLSSLSGVARSTAIAIVNTYGQDAIDKINNEPDTVKDEMGLTDRQINALVSGLHNMEKSNQLRQKFPELSAMLIDRINTIIDDPVTAINNNPYCITDIPGISFQLADAIGQRIGIDPRSPFRVNHGIVHVLQTEYMDKLFINLDNPDEYTRFIIHVQQLLKQLFDPKDMAQRLIQLASIEDSPIVIENYKGQNHLYLSETYTRILTFVRDVQDLNHIDYKFANYSSQDIQALIRRFELNENIALTTEQKNAAESAIKNNLSIITGGPGRGKTSMIKCIASCWHDKKYVLLLAPTGKAMNKLKTATGGGLGAGGYDTMTIDRLLATTMHIDNARRTKGPKSIEKYLNHMDECLFIIDESSMIDLQKAVDLFEHFPTCHYVLVGDIDQLPPISPGHILKELIESNKIPVAKLTKPLRNGGLILENADKINVNDNNLKYSLDEFLFLGYENDSDEALDLIMQAYNTERENVLDIQQLALVCPLRKGLIGTNSLNIKIQDLLCPQIDNAPPTMDMRRRRMTYSMKGFEIPNTLYGVPGGAHTRFRVGDIVINTKNNYQIETFVYSNNDYWNGTADGVAIGIFNGDCGRILAYVADLHMDKEGNTLPGIVVQFFDGRIAELDLVAGEFESFDLGYAITVHKSQGCEYDSIIYISPQSLINLTNIGFATKNLVYTAITRAKKKVIIVGSKPALDACIATNAVENQSTIHERI